MEAICLSIGECELGQSLAPPSGSLAFNQEAGELLQFLRDENPD